MSDLLAYNSSGPSQLRRLLERDELLTVPGCYDGLGARLIEQAGFSACYMTGFGTTAALLGRPDIGLLSATDMVDNARRVVMATTLPVIADADTGYGNPLNVMRTVHDYERAGVAAIQLEDQVAPKRCGHMDDKQVVPTADMTAKVRAAVAARHDDDLVIIARTDARANEGLASAIERAHAYVDAGADVLFVEALQSVEELETVAAEEFGAPLVYNWVEGGKTPPLSAAEIAELGFGILLLPVSLLLDATRAIQSALAHIKAQGTPPVEAGADPFGSFNRLVGLPSVLDLQAEFGS